MLLFTGRLCIKILQPQENYFTLGMAAMHAQEEKTSETQVQS